MDSLPAEERPRLELDLATAFYTLGAFYVKTGKEDSALESFKNAETILNKLVQDDPENGRIYELYFYISAFQEDYEKNEEYQKKAESLGITFNKEDLQQIKEQRLKRESSAETQE